MAGCGGKDLISLSTSVASVKLELSPVALGSALTGNFELVLKLGPEAPSPTEVSLSKVALTRAGTELRPILDATPSPAFPIAVDAGESKRVLFAVAEQELLSQPEVDELCSAPVQLVVVVTDTLSDAKTTTTASPAFVPACPP